MFTRRLFLAAPLVLPALAQSRPKIVASFSILADITRNIVGDKAEVMSLIPLGVDAHHFEPKPKDLLALKQADVFIYNGRDFEHGVVGWLKASGFKGKTIELSLLLNTGSSDPHLWQFVPHVLHYVENIVKAMPEYADNSKAYVAELKALHDEIITSLKPYPHAIRKVITTHDAFEYFGKGYGVEFLSPQGKVTGNASAKQIAALINQIRAEKIKAIFIENLENDKIIAQISKETGVKIGGSLYSDTLSVGGEADSYVKMMRHNVRALVAGWN